jgi:hypothetical protein
MIPFFISDTSDHNLPGNSYSNGIREELGSGMISNMLFDAIRFTHAKNCPQYNAFPYHIVINLTLSIFLLD